MLGQIQDVESEIQGLNTDLVETNNLIREVSWNLFDKMQEMLGGVQSESDWLIGLMENDKMFDSDTAKVTDEGMATFGLHAVNYNAYMSQADDYAKEIKKIDKELANDPYNTTLLDRREELLETYRDMVDSANQEKESIRSLCEEGYETFLDIMDDLIEKRLELLDTTRDLFEYERNVSETTEKIASLQKQIQAYSGDNSESTQATIQKLKISLEEEKMNLEDTEYERYREDQEKMLDSMRDETETFFNERLDQLDELLIQVTEGVNANADTIKATLETETAAVGTTLSQAMTDIWSKDGEFTAIVTTYGNGFNSALTTTNETLEKIRKYLAKMSGDADEKAEEKIENPINTPTVEPQKQETQKQDTSKTTTTPQTNFSEDVKKGVAAAIWIYGQKSGWGNDPYRSGKLTEKFGSANAAAIQSYINAHGPNGDLYNYWVGTGKNNLSKYYYSAFKSGGLADYTGMAWLDGTKQKPELVLSAKDTENFIELKDVLQKVDMSDLLAKSSINPLDTNDFTKNLTKLSPCSTFGQNMNIQVGDIQMYGVNDPETFAVQLQNALKSNKTVKKIIQADTLGVMTGKNTLSKFKYS